MKESNRKAHYVSEPGRPFSAEYVILSKTAEMLSNRGVPADAITVVGAALGIAGSFLLISPEEAIQRVQHLSNSRLNPSKKQIKIVGGIALGVSYFCDLLDGAVARKSDKGETRHGKILDGFVNKAVDASPALFELAKAGSFDKKATWLSYLTLAPVSTMIRSVGLQHDIPIAKTGLGARIGRVPILVSSMFFENCRDLLGKVLVAQFIVDSINRYRQIAKSGNETARKKAHKHLTEYFLLALTSQIISKGSSRGLVAFGLGLAKLMQVKIKEAYQKIDV